MYYVPVVPVGTISTCRYMYLLYILQISKRMPLVDKLIATYKVIGNGQKICTDVQTTPPGAEAQPAGP